MAINSHTGSAALPDGTVQKALARQAEHVPTSSVIRRLGDLTLTVGGALETIGLAPGDNKWLPVTGHVSEALRKNKRLRVDPETLEAELSAVQPGRATLHS